MLKTLPVIVLTAFLSSGCVAIVAGAAAAVGYIQYDKNGHHSEYEESLETVWRASVASMNQLGFEVGSDQKPEPTQGVLEVDDVKLIVNQLPEGRTRVTVRAGTFDTADNRRRAQLVLEQLNKRLL